MTLYPLSEIQAIPPTRYPTAIDGLDVLLGGGIVRGSTILFSGDRGAGKSTILLQLSNFIANGIDKKVVYVAGEENKEQIKIRAERMEINSPNIIIFEDTTVEGIIEMQKIEKPDIIVIDSLQMLYSTTIKQAPMTPTQMRYGLMELCKVARKTGTTIIFIGHATKGGFIAGLQTLQHMVDVVIYMGHDEETGKRSIRTLKNRFGESGYIWEITMTDKGIVDISSSPFTFTTTSNIINFSEERLNKLLENHPIWKPMVKASLNFLQKELKERKI